MIDFNAGDKHSTTWKKLKNHLKDLIDSRTSELKQNKTASETDQLRGRIRELEALIKIEEDQIVEDSPLPIR